MFTIKTIHCNASCNFVVTIVPYEYLYWIPYNLLVAVKKNHSRNRTVCTVLKFNMLKILPVDVELKVTVVYEPRKAPH